MTTDRTIYPLSKSSFSSWTAAGIKETGMRKKTREAIIQMIAGNPLNHMINRSATSPTRGKRKQAQSGVLLFDIYLF